MSQRRQSGNVEENWSLSSFKSDNQENAVVLHRKKSLASSLTEVLIKGNQHPHRSSSGLSLHEPSNFDQEELQDVYIEDLFIAGRKRIIQQVHNERASMGFWKLIWFDLKMWYRRWSVKHQETVFLKSYIKNMESNFGSAIGSLFVFMRWVIFLNMFLSLLWILVVILPAAIMFDYTNMKGHFAFKHLLDGKGMVANSWFFYGFYTSTVGSYNLDLAYFFMMLLTYFGSLYLILASINQNTKTKSTSSIGSRFPFAFLLWTSWDHTITSKDAAVNLSKGIASAFKDNLYELKASRDVKGRSRKEKIKVYVLRLIAWIITIILIGGGCVAIVYLVIYTSFERVVPDQRSGQSLDFISVYGTTVIFSLINGAVPVCIQQLPRIEQYHSGRDELNITLTRIFFLRMANLFALIISLYATITKSVEGCAGTVLGQEMYKLVILDTILQSAMQLIMNFTKYFWTMQKEEYKISQAVLVLIYRQALVWVGTLACPILPLVGLASNFTFFFVNYTVIRFTCKPPLKRWNQSRNTSFFTLVLLGSLAMLIPPASVVIGSSSVIKLGQTNTEGVYCGPFEGDAPTRAYTRFYNDQVSWLRATLRYIVSETVLIPLFLILFSVMIHFYRNFVSEKRTRAVLRAELQQEREENEMLIKKLERMGVAVQRGR